MTIRVDPVAFYDAARTVGGSSVHAADAVSRAGTDLADCGGMAGSDAGGHAWAGGYDPAARTALSASVELVTALDRMKYLLNQTGANYALAENASVSAGSGSGQDFAEAGYIGSPQYLGDGRSAMSVPDLPSTAGGTGGGPPGWHLIEGRVGHAWPNGHQDKLRAAAGTWTRAASGFNQARLSRVPIDLLGVRCRELTRILELNTELDTHVVDLSDACSALAEANSEFAAHLDHAHHQVIHELQALVAESAAISAAGALFTVVSGAVSDLVAGSVLSARCAAVAARVAAILSRLTASAARIGLRVAAVSTRMTEITTSIRAIARLRITAARTIPVRDIPALGTAKHARYAFRTVREARRAVHDWPRITGLVKEAAHGKGDFGLGIGSRADAEAAGRAWVGDGAVLASDGRTWVSRDGLRQFRPPKLKNRSQIWQANLESRYVPRGRWQNNAHLTIEVDR